MRLNNKGITTIEVLLCFIIVMIMAMAMYGAISSFNDKRIIEAYKEKVYTYKELVTKEIQSDLIKTGVSEASYTDLIITNDGERSSYANAPIGTSVYILNCRLNDGTSRELRVYKGLKEASNRGNTGNGTSDDFFLIEYGEVNALMQYPLPDLGDSLAFENNTSGGKIKDLIINNVQIKVENNVALSIYIGFYHPELSTRYAINILCPINYFSDKLGDPIFVDDVPSVTESGTYVASFGNDETGNGTLLKPFATLSKAYEVAAPIDNIYIMTNIEQNNTFVLNGDKNITLRSCTENGDLATSPHSVVRGADLKNNMLKIDNGAINFTNIIFDGNNVFAEQSMINVGAGASLDINEGVTLTKGVTSANGGAVYNDGGILNINGATVSNNSATNGGGIYNQSGDVIISSGAISDNSATETGGGIYALGNSEISGGSITNNTAQVFAGGFLCGGSCTLSGGSVTGNTAVTNHGGGISVEGAFTVTGGTIQNNSAPTCLVTNNISVKENVGASFYDSRSQHLHDHSVVYIASALNGNYVVDLAHSQTHGNILLYQKHASNNQKWKILPAKIIDGVVYYAIESLIRNSMDIAQVVAIDSDSTASGSNILGWEFDDYLGRYYSLEIAGSSYYYIKNRNLCMSVANAVATNNQNVRAETCNNLAAQKWQFVTS